MGQQLIIGIGGASRSGKSTLALQLQAEYEAQGLSVAVFHQDNFAFPESQLPHIRDHLDWDRPESMDFRRLEADMMHAIERVEVVIAEGILIFYDPQINRLFNRRIFIEIDKALFLEHRAQETRWGQEPDWYADYVWECHLRWGRTVLNDPNNHVEYLHRFSPKETNQFL